jgi:hypothetical protein
MAFDYNYYNGIWTSQPGALIMTHRVYNNFILLTYPYDGPTFLNEEIRLQVWISSDNEITFNLLDDWTLIGTGQTFVGIRYYILPYNTCYCLKVRFQVVSDGRWTGFDPIDFWNRVCIPPPPPPVIPPEPIIWPENTYFNLECNGINVTNGVIIFKGNTASVPYSNFVDIAISNGNWVIQYGTSAAEDHIALSDQTGSSDATISINPDGVTGKFELQFYLEGILMGRLYVIVNEYDIWGQ